MMGRCFLVHIRSFGSLYATNSREGLPQSSEIDHDARKSHENNNNHHNNNQILHCMWALKVLGSGLAGA
jgi:hypothetical protein